MAAPFFIVAGCVLPAREQGFGLPGQPPPDPGAPTEAAGAGAAGCSASLLLPALAVHGDGINRRAC